MNKMLLTGVVQKIENDMYVINTEHSDFKAVKAASCLIKPERGDKVLFFKDEICYILAVLETKSDITIEEENLSFKSQNLHFAAENICITAETSENNFKEYDLNALKMSFKSAFFTHISNKIEKIAKYFTISSSLFKTKAKKIDFESKINKSVSKIDIKQSKNIILDAENEVKIDGNIINMG